MIWKTSQAEDRGSLGRSREVKEAVASGSERRLGVRLDHHRLASTCAELAADSEWVETAHDDPTQ